MIEKKMTMFFKWQTKSGTVYVYIIVQEETIGFGLLKLLKHVKT